MKSRKVHKDMKKQAEEDQKAAELYWKEEYPLLPLEERKQIWLRKFYYNRRHTEESFGHKSTDMFTQEEIDRLRKYDAQVDEIIAYVKQELDNMWLGED
jgi:hypothetical protein